MTNVKYLIRNIIGILLFIPLIACLLLSYFKNLVFKKDFRSVYFIGNNYNAFYTLAEGLRKRGWRATSASPNKKEQFVQSYHKYINLSSEIGSVRSFLDILFNYKFLHVYNMTNSTLYNGSSWILRCILTIANLKKSGILLIFTPSGCLDGSTSKEINEITQGLCHKCIWQGNDLVCNDIKNQQRVEWIKKYCELFSNEIEWPKSLSKSDIGLNIPLLPLDSQIMTPNLIIPDAYKIRKADDEIIVFTAYGNENLRSNDQKDIKGKKYIKAAINKLISEGHPLIHFHANSIPSKDMRYYQVQADIIIDQLNYGTIGSAAREGMMLGKPVICHVSEMIRTTNIAMKDCPAIDATEESIYDVLKKLALFSHEERQRIGIQSRKWMLKWYDADVCAQRYEKVAHCLVHKLPLHPESQFLP
jgi:hypothetical protein